MGIIGDFRQVIALGIGSLGHEQDSLGAELHAKPAAFAAFFNQMNPPAGDTNAVPIEWLSPIFFRFILFRHGVGP